MTLKQYRESKFLTQKDMAEMIGISLSMYEKLEQNIRKPSLETMKKIKDRFKDFDLEIFLK